MHEKTAILINAAIDVLNEYRPMTLRQVYYQLVAKHIIDNNRNEYQRLSNALVKARQEGLIPWDWIEDRTRKPRQPNMWLDLEHFIDTVKQAYRKNTWQYQPRYIEVWLEKEALAGVFTDIIEEYGVTLVVGRGYNSWSAYEEAARRLTMYDKPASILYFGDFDPSGEDIVRALSDSLSFFKTCPEIEKVALTYNDVVEYNLPPDFTKATDSRSKAFIERYGNIAVELDALPLPVLQNRIRKAVEANLDLGALAAIRHEEAAELEELNELLA